MKHAAALECTARVKKLRWHSTFGEIESQEAQYRCESKRLRPFVREAQVRHRCCSMLLPRAVTDFAADVAYAQVMDKLAEHYGVLLNESTVRRLTQTHARQIGELV